MKLEIKHIAPYLPYGLEVQESRCKGIVKGIKYFDGDVWVSTTDRIWMGLNDIKPLLKPLSEFESFVRDVWENESDKEVMEYTSYEYCVQCDFTIDEIENVKTNYLPIGIYNVLLKHHFDVFNLIDNGLAEVKG